VETPKRSVLINGRKTSVSVEDPFWKALHGIARGQRKTVADLIADIDLNRDTAGASLTAAIRVWVMEHFQSIADSQPTKRKGGAPV
jgi:predicted DNA-binding ribbon-helix-helix protein